MPAPFLVASDFSPCAVRAIDIARRLAVKTGAPLHALHVLTSPEASPFADAADAPPGPDEAVVSRVRAALQASAPEAEALVASAPEAAPEIVATAERLGAVTVVGLCGRRQRRLGLGGVSGEVLQTATGDVVVVPQGATEGRVLVAVDFSGAAPALVRLGARLAEALGVGLDLVHVVEPLPLPVRWLDQTVVDLAPRILARAHEALRRLADAEAPHAELYVERGSAARTVAEVADALGAGLLLVGPHDDRPVLDGLLGSVAEGVARRAGCTVWVARSAAVGAPSVDARSYRQEAPV